MAILALYACRSYLFSSMVFPMMGQARAAVVFVVV